MKPSLFFRILIVLGMAIIGFYFGVTLPSYLLVPVSGIAFMFFWGISFWCILEEF